VLLPAAQEFLTSRGLISRPLTLRDAMSASPDTPRDAISTIVATAYSVIGGLVGLLTILVLTFYLLLEAGSIFKTFVSLFSEADRPRVADASRRVSRKLSAWLAGHLILAATMGTLSAIGLFLVGVPYFYVVAVVAAAGELVPILGPVVAGVSAVAIASTVSYKLALAALVYVTVLHQIEANVLVPKVLGRQVGLSPVAVIVSLLIGAGLRGIPGAILAPPTTAILKVVLEELTRRRVSAVSDTRNDED